MIIIIIICYYFVYSEIITLFFLAEEVVERRRSKFLQTCRVRRLLRQDQYCCEVANLVLFVNLLYFVILYRNNGLEGKETEEGKT